jgi:hypothetical protein
MKQIITEYDCYAFITQADGSNITVETASEDLVRLSFNYPTHTLAIEAEGIDPVTVSAKWGAVLLEHAQAALERQERVLAVCGSCRHFLQTHLAAEWSNGFSGYCRKAEDDKLDTVVEILSHCDEWGQNFSG